MLLVAERTAVAPELGRLVLAPALAVEQVQEYQKEVPVRRRRLPEQVAAQTDRVLAMELARRTEVQGRDLPELGQL